jgi:prepilin peptidase CpaA
VEYPGNDMEWIAFIVTAVAGIIAATIDVRRFRIPNRLTLPLCLLGLIFHTALDGLAGLHYSFGGIMTGLLVLILFYVLGVMGAGDVKLLAACGAWIGAGYTFNVFFVAAVMSGIYSLVVVAWQGRLRNLPVFLQVAMFETMTLGRYRAPGDAVSESVRQTDRRRRVLPFGLMIAAGLVMVGLYEFGIN